MPPTIVPPPGSTRALVPVEEQRLDGQQGKPSAREATSGKRALEEDAAAPAVHQEDGNDASAQHHTPATRADHQDQHGSAAGAGAATDPGQHEAKRAKAAATEQQPAPPPIAAATVATNPWDRTPPAAAAASSSLAADMSPKAPPKRSSVRAVHMCISGVENAANCEVSAMFKAAAKQLGGSFVRGFQNDVTTHVIAQGRLNAAHSSSRMLCGRTQKYMLGVLRGKWVVTIDWCTQYGGGVLGG